MFSYSNITLLVWLYIVLGFGYSFIMTWQKWYKSCFILWTYQLINIELFGHRYSTIVFVCVVTYVWTNHFQPTILWHQAIFTHSSTELRFTVSRHRSNSWGTISSARQTILWRHCLYWHSSNKIFIFPELKWLCDQGFYWELHSITEYVAPFVSWCVLYFSFKETWGLRAVCSDW